MAEKSAAQYRVWNRDLSSQIQVNATGGDVTLGTAPSANHTIYVQRIIAYVTTDAAVDWSFEDSASTAINVAKLTTSPGVDTRWDFVFGDIGMPLTEGKNFVLDVSATGAAGNIEWEGYARLTSPAAIGSTNS